MPLLPNDAFLTSLKGMFEQQSARATGKGSIYVTQKSVASKRAGGRPVCLYRVSDGRLAKFSTHVGAEESAKFHPLFMSILKVCGSARAFGPQPFPQPLTAMTNFV